MGKWMEVGGFRGFRSSGASVIKARMIYIQRNGKEHGPYNEAEAATYLQSGQLLPADLARTDKERSWRPLREVLAGPPAVPAQGAQPYQAQAPAIIATPVMVGSAMQPAQAVTVVDVKMPFGSMVVFMIKWMLASIPAIIVLWVILAIFGLIVSLIFGGVLGGFGSMIHNR
jgi:hypothetical protein